MEDCQDERLGKSLNPLVAFLSVVLLSLIPAMPISSHSFLKYLFFLFAPIMPAEVASGQDWPLVRGDAAMKGVSPTKLSFPLNLAWTLELGNKAKREGVLGTPVVRHGKAYVGSLSGRFACIELSTGKILWEGNAKGQFEGSAGFAGNLVIAGCTDSFVYAWEADTGKEVWKTETGGEVHAGVNLWNTPEGKPLVLIGSYDNKLYCLDATTGTKVWDYETANYVNGAATTYENQVIFGGCDGTLYVLDCLTGKEVKKIDIGAYIGNNVVADKGVAYLAHYGNRVAAYSFTDGTKLWEYGEREFPFYAAPAISETWVIAGGRDKRVHGLDRMKGEAKWQFRTRGDVDSSPVICADAHVLFGSNDGNFYALDLSKGEEVWRYEVGAPVKGAPAVAGDFILVGADDGLVYCFKNTPKP
jgi:outer membrane protein assembly factor BamB